MGYALSTKKDHYPLLMPSLLVMHYCKKIVRHLRCDTIFRVALFGIMFMIVFILFQIGEACFIQF